MSNITFKIISDPSEAKQIWETFSKHEKIDDEWDFREIFTKTLDLPFHFIVGYENEKPIGFLPLQLNTLKGLSPILLGMEKPYLEFYAGLDTDDNQVIILAGYEDYIPLFLEQVKTLAVFSSLKEPYIVNEQKAEHYLYRYELDLTQFANFEDFMQKNLDGHSRQRLINRINKIDKSYKVTVEKGTDEDLEELFKLSIERFGERSSFNMPQRQQIYRDLLKRFNIDLFVIKLDGLIKAISFGIVYNQTYTTLNVGYDYNIRDISKYMVVNQIKRALDLGCKTLDAGQGDNGWKEHFNLKKIEQFKLTLNADL